jgi:hypothetical protein
VRQSGLGAAHHGRISKIGRSHARAMLVEAAWTAAKAPGPLHAFFVRIRARRGHQKPSPVAGVVFLSSSRWVAGIYSIAGGIQASRRYFQALKHICG